MSCALVIKSIPRRSQVEVSQDICMVVSRFSSSKESSHGSQNDKLIHLRADSEELVESARSSRRRENTPDSSLTRQHSDYRVMLMLNSPALQSPLSNVLGNIESVVILAEWIHEVYL